MTSPRTSPYLYVTWIPRYLTGEKSCLFAAWFKANFQNYAKMPSDFDSAKWNMDHTDLMNKLVDSLEEEGSRVFIENQNFFKVESPRSGVVISGKSDVIAVNPDGKVVVYDAKTGQESASHVAQVQLYMYLLPRAQGDRWRGVKFEGVVVYADGREVPVSADSVNEAFVSRLTEFIKKMSSPMPARKVPSLPECRFCELTKADCPDRVEPELN